MFREEDLLPEFVESVLVVGGAGAGRLDGDPTPESAHRRQGHRDGVPRRNPAMVRGDGDLVVDHASDVPAQLNDAGIGTVDMVLSTRSTGEHLAWISAVLRPFGHLSAPDVTGLTDLGPLFFKSISIHTEVVFAKGLNSYRVESQSEILRAVAKLAADAKISTDHQPLDPRARCRRNIHQLLRRDTIGMSLSTISC